MASRIVIPSYHNGLYSPRRGGVARYPWAWRGCVGAWCPSLGATGGRLFDQSVYSNHGTLTNMDPATDWVVSGDGRALDLDGTDDHITCGTTTTHSPPDFSVSLWIRAIGTQATYNGIIGKTNGDTWSVGWGMFWQSASVIRFFIGSYSGNYVLSESFTASEWTHVVGTSMNTLSGIRMHIAVNGHGTTSGQAPGTIASATALDIGRLGTNSYNTSSHIDDVAIFKRRMSPDEIHQRRVIGRGGSYALDDDAYKAGAAPPAGSVPNFIHHYKMQGIM